jgi:hypothetical protein
MIRKLATMIALGGSITLSFLPAVSLAAPPVAYERIYYAEPEHSTAVGGMYRPCPASRAQGDHHLGRGQPGLLRGDLPPAKNRSGTRLGNLPSRGEHLRVGARASARTAPLLRPAKRFR